MKVVWCSDTHFNFVDRLEVPSYIRGFESKGDVVIYTGDLDSGNGLRDSLNSIGGGEKPSYYILGNHDFYNSSWAYIDGMCRNEQFNKAIGVEVVGPIKLTDSTVLVGVGGWADGRAGDFIKSRVAMSDHDLVKELSGKGYNTSWVLGLIRNRADRQQEILCGQIDRALEMKPKCLLVMSHAPMFVETNLAPNRRRSDKDWLPHFSWAGPRKMMIEYAEKNPEVKFMCLSGHTHTWAHKQIRDNLTSMVAGAKYYSPKVYEVLEVE